VKFNESFLASEVIVKSIFGTTITLGVGSASEDDTMLLIPSTGLDKVLKMIVGGEIKSCNGGHQMI
jgi:hypothetical protein